MPVVTNIPISTESESTGTRNNKSGIDTIQKIKWATTRIIVPSKTEEVDF